MNKADLIGIIAEKTGFTKSASEKAVHAILETINVTLADYREVRFVKFGTFKVKNKAARTIYNPRTGKHMTIKAVKVPVFKPSASLKDTVRGIKQ